MSCDLEPGHASQRAGAALEAASTTGLQSDRHLNVCERARIDSLHGE